MWSKSPRKVEKILAFTGCLRQRKEHSDLTVEGTEFTEEELAQGHDMSGTAKSGVHILALSLPTVPHSLFVSSVPLSLPTSSLIKQHLNSAHLP